MALVCKEIFNEVCILATGDVVCSCMDVDGLWVTGNLYRNRIYEIFRGQKYAELRRLILNSRDTSQCPSLGCNCPTKHVPAREIQTDSGQLTIKKIRLETISYCNLRCPECRVTDWRLNEWQHKRHPRFAILALDKIREVFDDTRETLRDVWLYNYGEPFLDKNFISILRSAREIVPGAWLYTHTNGTIAPAGWLETIVQESLLDAISFSIDGASQETFGQYRVGGRFDIAFNTMLDLVRLKEKLGKSKPDVTWQYILFEWNDSPEELARAQQLASQHGLKIQWLLTHTNGKSRRFTETSEEYQNLQGVKHYSSEILASQINRKTSEDQLL